jgi:hypothetical protein
MSQRITDSMLEKRIARINQLLGLPVGDMYEAQRGADGHLIPTGNYQLESAYNCVALTRNAQSVQVIPLCSKRERFDRMGSFIDGIAAARTIAKPAPVRIAVFVSGGICQDVECNAPFDYTVIDADNIDDDDDEEKDAETQWDELTAPWIAARR